MFFSSTRSDPFDTARREAGLTPPADGPSRRVRPVAGAVAVITAVAAVLFLSVSPVSGAGDDVAAKEAALRDATAARVAAERRVGEVAERLDAVEQELDRLGARGERLTAELAAARRDLREYAVAAYIDGGQTEIFRASLSPEKAIALSWQSNVAFGQSVTADEAAERFEELKEANTPERLAAAAELDLVTAELEEARFDAIQAAAHERDAESALAHAREAAARAAAERAAAAARAAAEREAAAARAARAATTTTSPPVRRQSAPTSAAAAAPATATAPDSSAAGNPTAAESATLAKIRRCESGGNYSAVSASGRYRGAYQFDRATWASVGGSGDPAAASPAEQDHRALLLLRQRGTRPWPVCGR